MILESRADTLEVQGIIFESRGVVLEPWKRSGKFRIVSGLIRDAFLII